LSVSIFSDTILEGPEDYTVTIDSPGSGTVATSQTNTVITDDDSATVPVWTIVGTSAVIEGEAPALYTVSYTGAILAPGQTMTILVGSTRGYDPTLNAAEAGADEPALGATLPVPG